MHGKLNGLEFPDTIHNITPLVKSNLPMSNFVEMFSAVRDSLHHDGYTREVNSHFVNGRIS
jgi:hypothetical protein